MYVQILQADLARAAAILRLLAPNLEEKANEVVLAVAAALTAIGDEAVAEDRCRYSTNALIDIHLELEDLDRRSSEEAA